MTRTATAADVLVNLLERGLSAIPWDGARKRPACVRTWKDYQDRAPTAAELQAWLNQGVPGCAIVTGAVSGLLVLDLDIGHLDPAALAEHGIELCGADPPTGIDLAAPLVRTGGGGWHVYYRRPAGNGWGNRAGILPGVDVRCDGGLVAAPPSSHPSGKEYRWIRPLPPEAAALPEPPEWLMRLLERPEPRQAAPAGPADDRYGKAALRGELVRLLAAPEGGRNHALYVAARSLGEVVAGGSLDRATVETRLAAAAEQIGLDPGEIGPTVQSGIEKGLENPRGPAPRHNGAAHPAGPRTGPRLLPLTDTGNARRLLRRHGQDLRYVHLWGQWLVWDGARWQPDETGEAARRALDIPAEILAELPAALELAEDDDAREEIEKAYHKAKKDAESAYRIRAALEVARVVHGVSVHPEQLDADPYALNVANGIIDLRTGQLRPHRRAELITKTTPYPYRPGAGCPRWEAFLRVCMLNRPRLVHYLQVALGSAATGLVPTGFFLPYGIGRNGKSSVLVTVARVLGDYARAADPAVFLETRGDQHPAGVADLRGRRMVMAAEAPAGRRLNESLVKLWTGGDPVKARFMRQDFFEFRPQGTLFFSANEKPRIKGTDLGIWRRVKPIPFEADLAEVYGSAMFGTSEEAVQHYVSTEGEGILAWLVAGAQLFLEHGLVDPPEIEAETRGYQDEQDDLGAFFEECLQESADPNWFTPTRTVFDAYRRWAEECGVDHPLSMIGLSRKLADRGYEAYRERAGRRRRGWRGITVVEAGGWDE